MKHSILSLLLAIATVGRAQLNVKGTVSQSLPGFFIIDKEPKSVSTPTTPRKLAATLLAGSDGNGGVRPDVAVEFAPFWLRDSSKIRIPSNLNANPNIARQTFAISIAAGKDDAPGATADGRKIGIGFRVQPIVHYNSAFVGQLIRSIPSQQLGNILQFHSTDPNFKTETSATLFIQTINDYIQTDPVLSLQEKANVTTAFAEAVQKLPRGATETSTEYIQRLQDLLFQPVKTYSITELYDSPWKWEIAGATALLFPTNKIDFSYMHRVGLWTTVSYTHMSTDGMRPLFTGTGMLRTLVSFTDSITTNMDFGISATARWWPDLPLSLEFTTRHFSYEFKEINQAGETINRIDCDNTYRLALTADFAISKDFSLLFTFGRDYDQPFQTSGNLLGIVGMNYTFGTQNKINP